jgi:ADP-ribose pyrophosphatase YjhB (NUDIX family)
MKYCGECGRPVTRQWVEHEARERCVCSSCGITHYQNPRILVGCLVCWRDKILLCRRAQQPAQGQWVIPSGYLECGETLEQGAARETFEEAGVAIDPAELELCSILNMPDVEQVWIVFRAQCTTKPETRPGVECLEVAFMAEGEIPTEQLAWRRALGDEPRQLFSELRSAEFSIRLISIASKGTRFKSRQYNITSTIREHQSVTGESGGES